MVIITNESGIKDLDQRVIEALKTCFDPEIPVNIYEMGLVYQIRIDSASNVHIEMTLTSPMCPVAETLPPNVEMKVRHVEGVRDASVEVTWEPPWTPQMMSEEARLALNMF